MAEASARACANIALAKYWGKCDEALNLPAVPSVSMTLDALRTETTVSPDASLSRDQLVLDGRDVSDTEEGARAFELLARVREITGVRAHARVRSENHFPTASGLASSASGFAALALAAARAYDAADLPLATLSALARRASASAARSVFGGFVELPAGAPGEASLAARPLAPSDHWDVAMVVALVTFARKKTGSRDGMRETAARSPYYSAWLAAAPGYAREVRDGVLARDLTRVGEAMEASTYAMHASALATRPALRYLAPATLALLDAVSALRASGVEAYATMDAGPHVKVLCRERDAESVARTLRDSNATTEVRVARPGPGAE